MDVKSSPFCIIIIIIFIIHLFEGTNPLLQTVI